MELKIDNKNSLTLTLLGYQFPHLVNVEYDSNWLNVKIDVRHEQGDWSATDPCVLTYEVAELIAWFREVSAGEYSQRQLEFLEPFLSFHLSPLEGVPDKLVIEMTHPFLPPWFTGDQFEQHQVVFPLASIDLLAAAQSLEEQLRRYPQRTEV